MPIRRHPVAARASAASLRTLPVDLSLATRLRGAFEQLSEHDHRLGEIFYAKLFTAAPHLKPLFHYTPAEQAAKLIEALKLVVHNLENPELNAAILADLGRRHATYGVKPEHYDLVIDLMIESMQELLGPTTDSQALAEWRLALRLISDQMIAAADRNPIHDLLSKTARHEAAP